MSGHISRFSKRVWHLAGLLAVAVFFYIAGSMTFVGLLVVGAIAELGFWIGLFRTDWKSLRANRGSS